MTENSHLRINQVLIDSLSQVTLTADLRPSEWAELWAKARDHCLAPYLHMLWTASGFIDLLPPTISARFSNARTKNAERNTHLLKVLDEIRVALHRRGIPLMICKGLPLAQTYYGDLGLRVLYDLDLLIKPCDRAGAFEILREEGFAPYHPDSVHKEDQTLFWRPREYAWDVEKVFDPDQPCFVEVHTSPWEPGWHGFRLRCSLDLWDGSRSIDVGGIPFRVPAEEKLLVHLAVHYACNVLESNARLMHLLDLSQILRLSGDQLDWDAVLQDIHESHAAVFSFLAFGLLQRVCGRGLPEHVRKRLQDATPRRIRDWLVVRGNDDACSMNLHNRERSVIYYLHWHMAAGCSETASVLLYSLRTPWRGRTRAERCRSLGRRMLQRLPHLARTLLLRNRNEARPA